MNNIPSKNKIYMPNMTSFEIEFYAKEGRYEPMDPEKFYGDIPDNNEEDNVQKPS